MGVPKLILLLGCIYYSNASQHTHTIPVEGYETELQDLGQHVDHHETPVKVIKITKTIAVKVPVPYPVKVVQKVPYPVHIVKPYPVPVPHIVNIPQPAHKHPHHAAEGTLEGIHHNGGQSYQVQEAPQDAGHGGSLQPHEEDSYSAGGHGQNVESYAEEYPSSDGHGGSSYEAPSHTYYGSAHAGSPEAADGSSESKSYDQAIQAYLNKFQPSSSAGDGGEHSFNGYH